MRLPAELRQEVGECFYLTIGTGGCLFVYSNEEAQEVISTLKNVNRYRESQLREARSILYSFRKIEEDSQGRFVLPEHLKKFAGIEKNIIIYRGPVCIEIWSEERWDEYFKDITFDNLADAIDSLKGINK